jgi:hypothetical protein
MTKTDRTKGDNLLNAEEYRQFWISWRDGHIKAGRGLVQNDEATVFVQWIDSDPLDITSLSVKSYRKRTKGKTIYRYYGWVSSSCSTRSTRRVSSCKALTSIDKCDIKRDGHIKAGRGLVQNDEATVFVQWIDSDPLNITSVSVKSYRKNQFIMHITNGEYIYQMFRNS